MKERTVELLGRGLDCLRWSIEISKHCNRVEVDYLGNGCGLKLTAHVNDNEVYAVCLCIDRDANKDSYCYNYKQEMETIRVFEQFFNLAHRIDCQKTKIAEKYTELYKEIKMLE